MRRDTQIGIILGVVILVVIGVFLSTRPSVEDTKMPNLILSEEGTPESEIEEIDINEIIKETKTKRAQKATPAEGFIEESEINEEFSKETDVAVESSKDDTSLQGKWEGVDKKAEEPEILISKIPVTEMLTEEALSTQQLNSDEKQEVATEEILGEAIHKVRSNDSLYRIAREYYGGGAGWKMIYEANRDSMSDPDDLHVGQELLIPEITVSKEESQAVDTPFKEQLYEEPSTGARTHTVVSGDTLYGLARKYYNDPSMWEAIYDANEDEIEDKSMLMTGQILIIPE